MTVCDLRGANLQGANLGHDNLGGTTDFIKADLSDANLRNCRIGGANFTGAIPVGADLRGASAASELPDRPARFEGADLTGARFDGANLNGARYDQTTRFSRGFHPDRAGMVLRKARRRAGHDDRTQPCRFRVGIFPAAWRNGGDCNLDYPAGGRKCDDECVQRPAAMCRCDQLRSCPVRVPGRTGFDATSSAPSEMPVGSVTVTLVFALSFYGVMILFGIAGRE